MLEWYGPDIKYIKRIYNDTSDALSMLPLINYDIKESDIIREHLSKSHGVDKLDR